MLTGKELIKKISDATKDYSTFPADMIPSELEANKWVLSRTSYEQMDGVWRIATVEDCKNASRGCPALAKVCYEFRHSKNYHPSRKNLIEICKIIKGEDNE